MKDGIYVIATLDFDWDTVVDGIVSNSKLSVSDVFDTDLKSDNNKLVAEVAMTIDRAIDSIVKMYQYVDLKVILTIADEDFPKTSAFKASGWQIMTLKNYGVCVSLEIADALVSNII